MKRFFVPVLLTMACVSARAQQAEEKIVAYFDAHWKRVYDSMAVISYYRTVVPIAGRFIVNDYSVSGVLQMSAECSAYEPDLIKDGKASFYDKSGHIKSEGNYSKDKERGLFHQYYRNGKLKEKLDYTAQGLRYVQTYDENGREELIEGNGLVSERGPSGLSFTEVVHRQAIGPFIANESTNDTASVTLEQQAEYVGGLEKMSQDISAYLRYPAGARRSRVQGTVYVAFVVETNGNISDVQVVKGIAEDCDNEAVRVVTLLNQWIPARVNNRVVRSRFVLPFKYRLE